MSKWTRTAGLLFLAASSVYSFSVARAAEPNAAGTAGGATAGVKVLEEASDPFANPSATTQPASEGKSVTATDVNVTDAGAVEIHVNDANLVEVLRMLSLQSQRNIIASKEVKGTVTANLYDVTVREALDAILHANGYAYREKGNFIYVYTAKEMAEQEKADRKVTTEVFRLFYTPAVNAVTMIKPVLSSEAIVASTTPALKGIETGTADIGGDDHATNDTIVVTDYPENLEKVSKVLKEIDRRPQQILVEATILRASLTEDNSLGVDFNFLGGVDFRSFTAPQGQVNGAEVRAPTGGTGGTGTGTTGGTTGGNAFQTDHANSVGTGTQFTQGINGFRVGLVTGSMSMFLSALESITDTTVLANPKVLALNKQKGEVIVGRKDGYLTTTVTQTSTVQTVDFLDTGTRLIFRPFIGDEGYIRMEIHPEDSSGGLNGSNLPFKITTEVSSNVMVKDGHTIVIGGLFREDSSVGRSQIPFFGNIPLAGTLFRRQNDSTTREEVIIMLTPHIIKDDKAYSDASEKERQMADKLRTGVRQGMMPTGRERLAEAEYQKAVEEMNQAVPDRKSAMWHLNLATNLNPTFSEAITLKQSVSGEEVSASDNSTIRNFVRQQIMADPAGSQPPVPRSVPIAPTSQPVVENKTRTAEAATTQPSDSVATTQSSESTATAAATTQPTDASVATTESTEPQATAQATAEATPAPAPAIIAEDDAAATNTATATATTQSQPVASTTETKSEAVQVETAQAPAAGSSAASSQPVAQQDEKKTAPATNEQKQSAVTELSVEELPGTDSAVESQDAGRVDDR